MKFGVLRVLNGTLSTPIFKEIGQTVPELLLLEVGSHFEWTRFFIDTLYYVFYTWHNNVRFCRAGEKLQDRTTVDWSHLTKVDRSQNFAATTHMTGVDKR